jgi:hypothetical protein
VYNPDFHILHMHVALSDIVGSVGVVFVLWAYLWLQLDKLSQDALVFSAINFLGSICIIYSLLHTWNFASFVIEISWLAISGYGTFKCLYRSSKKKKGDNNYG